MRGLTLRNLKMAYVRSYLDAKRWIGRNSYDLLVLMLLDINKSREPIYNNIVI